MPSLSTEYLQNTAGTVTIPVKELETRVIQYFQAEYTGGEWNPDNNYNWVPGAFRDFIPRRADSRIRFTMRSPWAWVAAGHAISNWYFFANGVLYWNWAESGTHIENGKAFQFEVPSWGTTSGRIGLQHRSHANDNNELRMYTTYYWDGTGRSVQNARGHMLIEEIVY
jgi:hypothetical protein